MAKQKQKEPDDAVPAFLRLSAEQRSAAWDALPPVAAPRPVVSVKRGEYPEHWLRDPGTRALIEETRAEKERKKTEREEKRAETRAMRPKRVSAVAGLVPLKKILADMAEKAPRRRHAIVAIDAAKIEHTKYHFVDSVATLARVRRALEDQLPPDRRRRAAASEFPPEAKIVVLVRKNPRREGSGAHDRMQKVMGSHRATVAQFLESGGNPTTLQNAVAKKWAEVKT